ncbi:hypothetical protein ACTMTI_18360 [Nonomuraea sp. H19]|uniref:hypothetical protein n=1 Tax=Nonomuraea sp. H19 TaxID=3452206 RepID=UPI003F8A631A
MTLAVTPSTTADAMTAQERFTFLYDGVILWSQPNPRSVRMGLGYRNQEFVAERDLNGERYVCQGGESQDLWYYGRNSATGVKGWVNFCNLSYAG